MPGSSSGSAWSAHPNRNPSESRCGALRAPPVALNDGQLWSEMRQRKPKSHSFASTFLVTFPTSTFYTPRFACGCLSQESGRLRRCVSHLSFWCGVSRVQFAAVRCASASGLSPPERALADKTVTWLILPVVICLSQRLSHACLSINNFIL